MPPFPWHLGGQSYHNLFVKPDEIIDFCSKNKMRICLDTSHLMMASNYYNFDFKKSFDELLKYTSHLHIADAIGIDQEGCLLGDGQINFQSLGDTLIKKHFNITFIPEVWQGHRENGLGFKNALIFLEKLNYL